MSVTSSSLLAVRQNTYL